MNTNLLRKRCPFCHVTLCALRWVGIGVLVVFIVAMLSGCQ
jgi:hypothetical protein